MPESSVQPQSEAERMLQMKGRETVLKSQSLGSMKRVSLSLNSAVQGVRTGGRTLNEQERNFFEPRMGADFSAVRVHSEPEEVNIAAAIGARAFTIGNHITMARGERNFHSPQGKQLLAHELAHVLQHQSRSSDIICRVPRARSGFQLTNRLKLSIFK